MDIEIRKEFTGFARLFTSENDIVCETRILRKYPKSKIEKALELNIITIDHIDGKTGERYFRITDIGKDLW